MTGKRKVALHNLGCKVNAYETDAMALNLTEHGYERVDFEPGADVYIINTCTVTNIADRKSRQMLHRAKKMNPKAVVVAVGCYVQAAGEELLKDEAIDIIVGTNRKSEIVHILDDYFKEREKTAYIEDVSHGVEYEDMEMTTVMEHTRAFVKIQDGCNRFCTYCIIPYSRGRIRSRRAGEVLGELEKLAKNGYREIILTGIHLSSYGIDLPEENGRLADIIEEAAKIEGIDRIRLGSLEPGIIDRDFLERIKRTGKVCPHFHLSLQSGSDSVLRRMNRRYDTQEYYEKCGLIREYFDHPALTTDIIVGFPGESEEEFSQTVNFAEKVGFFEIHVFKYSPRKGTVAAAMDNQIEERVKSERSECLIKKVEELREKFMNYYQGRTCGVLFEEEAVIDKTAYMTGYTREYVRVAAKLSPEVTGRIIEVKIKQILNQEILLAELN